MTISRGSVRTTRAGRGRLRITRALAFAIVLLWPIGVTPQAPDPPSVQPDAAVDGLTPKFVSVNGVRTRYYEYGEGEPIVLVHGGGRGTTSSANNWSRNIRGLAERFHVFAVDKSAAGMTGNPRDDRDLNRQGEVKHMYEFIQTMKLGQVHLVGHSSGGALAFFLAVEHPDVVKTLIVVSHGPGMPSAGEGQTKLDVAQEACAPQTTYEGRQCRLMALAHTSTTFDKAFVDADAWMANQPKSKQARAKYAARSSEQQSRQNSEYRQRMWDRARSEGALPMPILIYAGKQDTLSWIEGEPSAAMRGELGFFDIVGAKNPRVSMIVINEAGHFPYREHPAQFNADLIGFIEYWSNRR
ncbi:MAG: alpha/beta hydrolase [Acidobacteriota bacterium]